MSSGILEHSFFGLVQRYIHKNKYVLEVEYDLFKTQYWSSRYHQFLYTYLTNKSIKFVLFPDQIYIRKCSQNSILKDPASDTEKRIITYDHFVLTLGQEVKYRIQYKQQFSLAQLWYFLGCLINGASELAEIHSRFNNDEELIINPDTVLINQYGLIKMLGYYSSPNQLAHCKCFQTPTAESGPGLKKHVLSATFSVGRIMSSLVLLQQLKSFQKEGMFDKISFDSQLLKYRQRIGILYNIIIGMMQGIPQQRILLHEISALLYPYEECILKLSGFRLDRGLCKESMVKVLTKKS